MGRPESIAPRPPRAPTRLRPQTPPLCTHGRRPDSLPRLTRFPDRSPAMPADLPDDAYPATNGSLNRKLRMALVGGGSGSFIGRVHATGAVLDNRAEIVAGALSSNPERAKKSAPSYAIPQDRAYTSIHELVEKEAALPEDQRIDFVSIATPNHTHFEIAKTAAEAGFNVICDKPMTFDYAQAEALVKVVEGTPGVFALMHNYTGYPLIRQAREMCLNGDLGEVNAIRSNYIQGWLRDALEETDQKQASWRTDPGQERSRGGVRRYRHARLQPRSVHDGLPAGGTVLQSQDLRGGPSSGRLRQRGRSLSERGAGHRDGLADLARPREQPVHRDRRHEGVARLAAGEPQRTVGSPERPAVEDLHPRSERPLPIRPRRAAVADCPAGTRRGSSRRSPTSTRRRSTR